MIITFNKNSDIIFGKIKIAENPIFDLDKFNEFNNSLKTIRELFEKELNISSTPFFIKPPKPGTILGNTKYTIRTNNAKFKGITVPEIFSHLDFGIGEKGYYYDIKLNIEEVDHNDFLKNMEILLKIIENFEKKIENNFHYLKFDLDNEHQEFTSISNFQATLILNTEYLNQKLDFLHQMTNLIQDGSEELLKNTDNIIFPDINFNIVNEMALKAPQILREKNIPLEKNRFFKIQKLFSSESSWRIVSRGIVIRAILKIFDFLFI